MTVVPFRHFIPIVLAAIVVGGLHSSMSEVQSTATFVLRRYEVGYLVCAATVAIVLLGIAEALATSTASALLVIRGFVVWMGLALLSGRLLGWLTNWLLPVLTVFPLVYYGLNAVGNVQWWNWTGQPSSDAASWLIAATSLAVGATAFTLTPWRFPRLTVHFRPN
ncbi:hypothetical protein [Actinomadura pelletieri]|nr:hypothetical protein [Actinomadura pelletieri]